MPKITAKGPSYADQVPAPDAAPVEPIVVDEHGDDAAAVAAAPPAPASAPVAKPAGKSRRQ